MNELQKTVERLKLSRDVALDLSNSMQVDLNQQYYKGEFMAFDEAVCLLLPFVTDIMPLPLPDDEEEEEGEGEGDFVVSDEEASFAYFCLITRYSFEDVCRFGTHELLYPRWLVKEIKAIRSRRDQIRAEYLK